MVYEIFKITIESFPKVQILQHLLVCEFSFYHTLQSTIAVSKLVTNLLGQNDSNLRKSLSTIATFVTQDEKVKVCQSNRNLIH